MLNLFQVSQTGNDLHNGSIDRDLLDDEYEEDDSSVDDQGYDMETDSIIQHQGLLAHQNSERILNNPEAPELGGFLWFPLLHAGTQ